MVWCKMNPFSKYNSISVNIWHHVYRWIYRSIDTCVWVCVTKVCHLTYSRFIRLLKLVEIVWNVWFISRRVITAISRIRDVLWRVSEIRDFVLWPHSLKAISMSVLISSLNFVTCCSNFMFSLLFRSVLQSISKYSIFRSSLMFTNRSPDSRAVEGRSHLPRSSNNDNTVTSLTHYVTVLCYAEHLYQNTQPPLLFMVLFGCTMIMLFCFSTTYLMTILRQRVKNESSRAYFCLVMCYFPSAAEAGKWANTAEGNGSRARERG